MLKASLIGNLGADPEMRYSPQGTAILTFSVACNERQKVGDEWQDRTEWVRVRVLGTRAETLSQHLKKGSRVYVDGRLEARPWTDQQGQARAGLEILANDVQFVSPRVEEGRADNRDERIPAGAGVGRSSRQQPDDNADLEDLPF